jgi:hypothetical protein
VREKMAYFKTRDVAAIAICGALWGVLNVLFAPIFFRATGMPFLCDLIGFAVLILAAWWIRKPGALIIVGLIATIINLTLVAGTQFLGFLVASIFFDVVMTIIGYCRAFRKSGYITLSMMIVAISSAALAGTVIGTLFMTGSAMIKWGGVVGWAGLHMIGGVIGGVIGITLVLSLKKRKINVYSEKPKQN